VVEGKNLRVAYPKDGFEYATKRGFCILMQIELIKRKEVRSMPVYIMLMKATNEAAKDSQGFLKALEDTLKTLPERGIKLLGFYATMGRYDYIVIGEASDDEAAWRFAYQLNAGGWLRSETLKALPFEELSKILLKTP
jgi:uncharacterized protein with GYD domain